jgi:hypothetical protein
MKINNLKDLIKTTGWQRELPTEPGTVWLFHGKIYNEVELHIIEIWQIGNGVSYVSNGSFLWPNNKYQGFSGLWKRLTLEIPAGIS